MAIRTNPETVLVNGEPMKCLFCTHTTFHRRRVRFDLSLVQDLNPEWRENLGSGFICHQCGYLHWFVDRPAV